MLKEKSDELLTIVNTAEDGLFGFFCQKIGVSNIREYEERQLKVAQEESQARLRHDTQIARLTNQYVFFDYIFCKIKKNVRRIDFEKEGLAQVEERMDRLEAIIHAEEANIERLKIQKITQEKEIKALEGDLLRLREELESSQEILDEKTKALDEAKRTGLKVSKVLDQALKEIATWVSG